MSAERIILDCSNELIFVICWRECENMLTKHECNNQNVVSTTVQQEMPEAFKFKNLVIF